jgi:hypothetical protein
MARTHALFSGMYAALRIGVMEGEARTSVAAFRVRLCHLQHVVLRNEDVFCGRRKLYITGCVVFLLVT